MTFNLKSIKNENFEILIFRTRTEIEDILDYACQLSDEANQERCLELIHKETDVLFDFIQKVTDPDTICSAIQVKISIFFYFVFLVLKSLIFFNLEVSNCFNFEIFVFFNFEISNFFQ